MRPIIINGFFLERRQTGIERFASEIVKKMDTLCRPGEIFVIVAPNCNTTNREFTNISYIRIPFPKVGKRQWKRIKLQKYLITHTALSLNFDNTCTLLYPGVVFLHDIYCRQFPQDYKTGKERKIMFSSRIHYWWIAHFAKVICTVSEYSKAQIVKYYHVKPEKIRVIYDSADYMKTIVPDPGIFEKYPELKTRPYYFTLGSLSLRKNLKWIADHAEHNPDELFVISGAALKDVVPPELEKLGTLPNIISTGYLSDGQVKALMQKCRAFIFPSYFEGFGLPPLEALLCGAPVIISNTACLPEIYGSCVHYIDPFNPDVDLDKLLSEPVEAPDKLFQKYSLEKNAEQLYSLLRELAK